MEISVMDRARIGDAAKLANRLWDEDAERAKEFEACLQQQDFVIFLAYEAAVPVGFAQCQLRRDYVEGCDTSPVGYLEGIYVDENVRGAGVARALLSQCEAWAKQKGCTEFASDCELDNEASIRFHAKVGFTEQNRIVCFKKTLQ